MTISLIQTCLVGLVHKSSGFTSNHEYIYIFCFQNFGRHGLPFSAGEGLTTLNCMFVCLHSQTDCPITGAGGRAYKRKFCQVWEAYVKKECNEVAVD